jgi:hypothetical protein
MLNGQKNKVNAPFYVLANYTINKYKGRRRGSISKSTCLEALSSNPSATKKTKQDKTTKRRQ